MSSAENALSRSHQCAYLSEARKKPSSQHVYVKNVEHVRVDMLLVSAIK